MSKNKITKYEKLTLFIALIAIIFSAVSLYLQFYKTDKLLLRQTPITSDGNKVMFDLITINRGNISGMVNFTYLLLLSPGSHTKGKRININKSIVVAPGEIKTTEIVLKPNDLSHIKSNNEKHNIRLYVSYLDSNAAVKQGNIDIGFLCWSSNTKTVYTKQVGYLDLTNLKGKEGSDYLVEFEDDKYIRFGSKEKGYEVLKK